jgi:low affinity Fe/Cu permease
VPPLWKALAGARHLAYTHMYATFLGNCVWVGPLHSPLYPIVGPAGPLEDISTTWTLCVRATTAISTLFRDMIWDPI